MKKYSALLLVTVFAAALLTGCGCRNTKPAETTMPTTMPTATAPATQATQPSTEDTTPVPESTIEDGNGPLPTNATAGADGDTSDATESTDAGNSRNRPSNTNPTTGIDGRTHRVMPNR